MTPVRVQHKGFKVEGLVGSMSAEISEAAGYVEVTLVNVDDNRTSYDLSGLTTLVEDLRKVLSLAEEVERVNVLGREVDL